MRLRFNNAAAFFLASGQTTANEAHALAIMEMSKMPGTNPKSDSTSPAIAIPRPFP